jgi:hypothetical protein
MPSEPPSRQPAGAQRDAVRRLCLGLLAITLCLGIAAISADIQPEVLAALIGGDALLWATVLKEALKKWTGGEGA